MQLVEAVIDVGAYRIVTFLKKTVQTKVGQKVKVYLIRCGKPMRMELSVLHITL